MKGRTEVCDPLSFSFAVSPFFQTSNFAKDDNQTWTELGNVDGKWNMIALLPFNDDVQGGGNDLPIGKEFPEILFETRKNLLTGIQEVLDANPNNDNQVPNASIKELQSVQGLLTLQDSVRAAQDELFGYFSVPIRYKKFGARFELNAKLFDNFGIAAQTGVVDISQIVDLRDQLRCAPSIFCQNFFSQNPQGCQTTGSCIEPGVGCNYGTPTVTCANPFQIVDADGTRQTPTVINNQVWAEILSELSTELMNRLPDIAEGIGLDLCNFNKTGIEDVHVEAFWRKAYPIESPTLGCCLTRGLFIPFAAVGASFPSGKPKHPSSPFSVAFGNNGHYAVRADVGFSFDFVETIEVGAHGGLAHFFPRKIRNYRVPSTKFQTGVYPFTTDIEMSPGNTWHIGIFMNAYHFLECLSFYGEYLYVTHQTDHIKLTQPDNVFRPDILECQSPWMVQLLNFGFNYDISRNFRLGGFYQLPLQRRHAAKSTTYMLTAEIVF